MEQLYRLVPAIVACDDGVGPGAEAGNVDAIIGATVVETDTGVVVPGEWRLPLPSNHKALWLDRFLHYEFGGFPELEYPQNTRLSETWRLQLTHEKDRVARNDSTIFSFVDHGVAAVADSTMEKLADLPLTATFSTSPMARLIELRSGDELELDRDTPPVLRADKALALGFDRPLDPDRAYVAFIPWPNQGGGAQRAFIRPKSAADRMVVPASVLAEMVANASRNRVAYLVVIEEFWWQSDAFAGRFAHGEPFSLPFVQEGETTLLVYLER